MIPRGIHGVVLPQTRGEVGYECRENDGKAGEALLQQQRDLGKCANLDTAKKTVGKVYKLFALGRGNGVPYFL